MKNNGPVKTFKFIFLLLASLHTTAQEPLRKIWAGVNCRTENNKLIIDTVFAQGAMQACGLQAGDQLLRINTQNVTSLVDLQRTCEPLRAGDSLCVEWMHQNQALKNCIEAPARPKRTLNWCNLEYGWVQHDKAWLRSMVYKPKNSSLSLPAIFFLPGYTCSSIESFPDNYNGRLIRHWVEQGFLVYTVEKSGMGDNANCLPCQVVDLGTDISFYTSAWNTLCRRSDIRADALFIWGHSMGGILAPLIHGIYEPKGILVYGTVYRPWSEFLLEMHRVQKPLLEHLDAIQTEEFLRTIQAIYFDFFVRKKTPAELDRVNEYHKLVRSELEYEEGKESMWGRHWRFWQQLDSLNLAEAWQQTKAQVLVMHGGADYIQCSALEPYLIREAVHRAHAGKAELLVFPDMDHLLLQSRNFEEAVQRFNRKEYLNGALHPEFLKKTSAWMKGLL